MPPETSMLAGPHWPHSAAAAAGAAFVAKTLDAAALRLLDRWFGHLAKCGVAVPRGQDFIAFGSASKLESLRDALGPVTPGDLAPIHLALQAKRSETWRRAHPVPETRENRKPRRPAKLSVPLTDLPKSWLRALREMRALRQTLDAGLLTIEDRTPPSAKVIKNLGSSLRVFGGVCRGAGDPIELTVETFTAWRAARRAAGNRDLTIASRCKELALFAAWCDMDEDLIAEIHDRRRRHLRASKGQQKRKEAWMLSNDVGIGDVWIQAEDLLEEAEAAQPGSALRVHLTLDAACLALSVVAPLRVGDLHRIQIGEHLRRWVEGWSLSIVTDKSGLPYDRTRLWPEITPFLDAVVALHAPGRDFWTGYDARSVTPTSLFSQDGGKTDCGELWPTQVWTRHFGIGCHIVRSLWHQMMFESEDDEQYIALALCGQGHGRTAAHYIMQGNRRRANRRGRAKLREARRAA